MTFVHHPVLLRAVVEGLALKEGAVVLDATVGLGGHAEQLLRAVGPRGHLIGIDRDSEALKFARRRLSSFGDQVTTFHGRFGELKEILSQTGFGAVNAALFDLGVSSLQLEKADRGFSFVREGPLDMRMSSGEGTPAADLVNHTPQREIEEIIRSYGEERYAGRIARSIVKGRPFFTTTQLAQTIRHAVPAGARHGRIDPATRTFQALRIAVNQELQELPAGLTQAIQCLKPFGRIAVLAYHSLEDRIVKVCFREQARAGILRLITRKPVRPSPEETAENPRSRSACLRIAEVVG